MKQSGKTRRFLLYAGPFPALAFFKIWTTSHAGAALGAGKNPVSLRINRIMTYAWAGIFAFSGNFKAYLHIQNGTCVLEDRFSGEPDLMTHTPSEVWLEIARKELSGQQAFFVRRVHGGWQSGAPDEDERILFRGGPFIKGGKFRHQRNGADFFGKAERHKKTHSLNPTTKERKIP